MYDTDCLSRPAYLKTLVHDHDRLVEFLLDLVSLGDRARSTVETYNVVDDALQQQSLLVFVWTFLCNVSISHQEKRFRQCSPPYGFDVRDCCCVSEDVCCC